MSDPIIEASDLAVYLNDPSIDTTRAEAMIADAQALCLSVVNPLPDGAEVVVKRIAGRGYVGTVTTRTAQAMATGAQVGVVPGAGGVYLTRQDKADLRRLAGGGGAFSINLLPANYTYDLPSWEIQGVVSEIETS